VASETAIPVRDANAPDQDDIHSAALCAWKEARGEGVDGMRAVLWVLKNRVGVPGFGSNLHNVIYGKNQFTSMSVPSDPEFNLDPEDNDSAFAAAMQMATALFDGETKDDAPQTDPTRTAHYYANLHLIAANGWFYKDIVLDPCKRHPVTAQIGHHTFFA
jgi:spore germination cell wall hydrolase CwlJ-like protein